MKSKKKTGLSKKEKKKMRKENESIQAYCAPLLSTLPVLSVFPRSNKK
jgi:hypothetical protein